MLTHVKITPADVQLACERVEEENRKLAQMDKAARNAAYLGRLRQSKKNLDEGKGIFFTWEEFEELCNGRFV